MVTSFKFSIELSNFKNTLVTAEEMEIKVLVYQCSYHGFD